MTSYVTRKTPGDTSWFTHDRFGMFIHFGLYAMPARHEWVKTNEKISEEHYDLYFKYFNPDLYDPRDWARQAKAAGMKYVVMTTKHHEGFCLFDSQYTDYKSTNTPCGKDLIKEYVDAVPTAVYTEGKGIWTIPCDIALPCATQNEITAAEAEEIVKGGAMAVAEGANMPSTPEAIAIFQKAGLLFAPAKAANAGGVAVSALEMSQNSMRYSWTFEEVDAKLQGIMVNIFHNINNAAKEYGMEGNLVAGANLAGFKKVSEAMIAQGVV